MIRIDASDFTRAAADLDRAAGLMSGILYGPMNNGARAIKERMKDDFNQSQSFRPVARSVSYDIEKSLGGVTVELGPETAGRVVGDLAHIAYFGGSNGGGGTVPDPVVHLEAEADVIERYIGEALEGLL